MIYGEFEKEVEDLKGIHLTRGRARILFVEQDEFLSRDITLSITPDKQHVSPNLLRKLPFLGKLLSGIQARSQIMASIDIRNPKSQIRIYDPSKN